MIPIILFFRFIYNNKNTIFLTTSNDNLSVLYLGLNFELSDSGSYIYMLSEYSEDSSNILDLIYSEDFKFHLFSQYLPNSEEKEAFNNSKEILTTQSKLKKNFKFCKNKLKLETELDFSKYYTITGFYIKDLETIYEICQTIKMKFNKGRFFYPATCKTITTKSLKGYTRLPLEFNENVFNNKYEVEEEIENDIESSTGNDEKITKRVHFKEQAFLEESNSSEEKTFLEESDNSEDETLLKKSDNSEEETFLEESDSSEDETLLKKSDILNETKDTKTNHYEVLVEKLIIRIFLLVSCIFLIPYVINYLIL